MYEAGFRPVSSNYYPKLSGEDKSGGGCSTSYLIVIFKDGTHFIARCEYIDVLSPHTTWYMNKRIKE